ncbi:LuxR C-terminal-related transcriptional regulator [Hyalangium gracile]|uniref:LuxR C-terminal-related transcriptional regulator n=1 Tax=Hyalangium gracile TaxID=394092 RepID=UPI001CCC6F6C|nr:LuxR C-terminal-related transcriptional regulator [Hyalangium gracile]
MAVLSSSLDLNEVQTRFYEHLSRPLGADHAALCVSKPGRAQDYDWMVAQIPQAFFAHYSELAGEDFVLRSVVRHRNMVLRDSEMVSRTELKRSPLYAHCRNLGMPMEYVMAVLLDQGLDWHGGLTLYRDSQRHPFTDDERIFLQRLTPMLASTLRNCRLLGKVAQSGQLLEALCRQNDFELVVLNPPSTEVMRTSRATELLERWFLRLECSHSGLPIALLGQLGQLVATGGPVVFGQDTLVREKGTRRLVTTFVPLPPQDGKQLWALVLQESSIIPEKWRKQLTEREVEAVEAVMQGWDNQTISSELQCALDTVKVHLRHSYSKLGVGSRAKLISAASELNGEIHRLGVGG